MKKIKDVTLLLDGTASFEMSLSHDNIPVRWMFNGVELQPSDRCKVVSERKAHRLTLQNVDGSSAGEYAAVVGHLQCSAVLTVEGNVCTRVSSTDVSPSTSSLTLVQLCKSPKP